MSNRSPGAMSRGKKLVLGAAMTSVAAQIIMLILNAPAIRAQDATDWQTKAGGKMAFEVASVKPAKGAFAPSNVSLTPWDDFGATNGRFRADAALSTYIAFAYPCDKSGNSPGEGLPGFPGDCRSLSAIDKPGTTLILMGSRDVTMDVLAAALSSLTSLGLGRPVINKTGLTERFDFTLEWARESRGPAASDPAEPDIAAGPTPVEALRDQLGLKLEPARASLPILIIDRVERPTDN